MAWLLWIMGFAPLHLGDTKGLSDGADIIAVSADGRVLVVECTLGGLKTDNKLQKLIDRTSDVRQALDRANAGHIDCFPVMVTTRARAEIADDIAEYERRGVLVFTNDDIEPLLSRTLMLPQSSARFGELKQRFEDIKRAAIEQAQRGDEIVRDVKEIKKTLQSVSDLKSRL